jgi:hypothetical protein
MGASGPNDLDIGINITTQGEDIAFEVAGSVAAIRKELKLLADQQLAGKAATAEAIAQQKQLRDELAASARQISADRKAAIAAERADLQTQRDQLAASARQIAADRKASLAQERADRQAALNEKRTMSAEERAIDAQVTADIRKATREIAAEKAAARAAERTASRQARDELLASSRQIAADRKASLTAERDAAKQAAQNAQQATAAQRATAQAALTAGRAQLAQARAVQTTSTVQKEHIALINSQSGAYQFLIQQLAAVTAAFAGFQLFKTFIAEGLQFNRIIETSNLGIAALITSQTEMKDNQGAVIVGVDKLRVAQVLATDQVQKLRIAGLQTTATTEQLVGAFQQAVAIGLRWGLTLDQIRIVTVQMSQAAGALGVPLNQMNEEIRSLLTGTITPRNTRIATALGITNEQIRQAQKAGTLFDFVTKRLEAFSVAGESTAKTFVGVMSNVKEALQNLSGDATKPLFEALKVTGQETLEQIFDLKNARITTRFAGILDVAKEVFGDLGNLLADAISSGISGAKDFNKWLIDNRLEFEKILEASRLVGDEIILLVKDVFNMVLPLGDMAAQVGVIKTTLVGVGVVVASIREMFQIILVVLGVIGFTIISSIVAPMSIFLGLVGKAVGLFNKEWGEALERVAEAGKDFVKGIAKGIGDYTKDLVNGGSAVDQFIAKVGELDAATEKSAAAHEKLRLALEAANRQEQQESDKLDDELKKKQITQKQYVDAINTLQIVSVKKQIAAEKEYFNSLDVADDRERKRTVVIINELKKRESALQKNVTIKSIAEPPPPKDSALKEEEALTILIKAQLDARLKDLKISLDNNELSYDAYYKAVIKANQDAIDKQVAALQILQAAQTDKGAQAKTLAEIKALGIRRAQIVDDETEKERQAYLKLNDDVVSAHVQLLKDQGRLVEAADLETGNKFRKLIAQLKEEVRSGTIGATEQLGFVEQLFGIDQAKVALQQLERSVKVIQDTLATQLSEINTESKTSAITESEAREKIVAAYKNARDQLVAMLPALREQARLTRDPTAIDNAKKLNIEIQQMDINIQQIGDDLLKLKVGARDAFESGLGQFLDDAVAGAKDLGTSFRDAARSIVDSLRKIATQMLANLIIQKLLQFAGFASGGFAGSSGTGSSVISGDSGLGGAARNAASGGHITGPGTTTSDSIPAWLSNGEYVIRATAVQQVGVDLLDQINAQGDRTPRARRRLRGYAEGGLVTTPTNDSGTSARLDVGLEDGLVLKHLETPAGQKTQLRFIERNAKSIRRVLGV